MASSLVRGKYVICKVHNRNDAHVKQFYADEGYLDETECDPFDRLNCRH